MDVFVDDDDDGVDVVVDSVTPLHLLLQSMSMFAVYVYVDIVKRMHYMMMVYQRLIQTIITMRKNPNSHVHMHYFSSHMSMDSTWVLMHPIAL